MRHFATACSLAVDLICVSGCDLFGPRYCTTEAIAAISVEIRDVADARPLADSATARVTDGSFSDTLMVCALTMDYRPLSRCGVWERPGTYDVLVTRRGYLPWSQTGVHVSRGKCHVEPSHLRASLASAP